MENQFLNEPLEMEPESNKPYYVLPLEESAETSTGFTHLMKLVLCAKHNNGIMNVINCINYIVNSNPHEINKQNDRGYTALMMACMNIKTSSNIEIVKLLLNQPNINVNEQNGVGRTALMLACIWDCDSSSFEIIKLLLDRPNIDINKKDNGGWTGGWTALMFACVYSNIETVKLLLNYPNIDVNKQNNDGETALMAACRCGGNTDSNIGIIKLLLSLSNIYIDGDTSIKIIQKNISCAESLMSIIFCPLNFSYNPIIEILKSHNNKNKFIYYCYLHINIKKEILKNIPDYKEQMYYKPNNIIALCSEISFKLKFKSKTQVFEELDDKLKFIFDIKNEDNMIDKISFYL